MRNTLLWLDDYRDPNDTKIDWLVFSPIGKNVEVIWIKTYNEFVEYILTNGLPEAICFDHDLSDFQAFKSNYPELMEDVELPETEKTGYDCAKWLIDYCLDNNLNIPKYNIQSANPIGKENIDKLLKSFNKFKNII